MLEDGTKLNTKKMTIEELEARVGGMNFNDLREVSNELRKLQNKIERKRIDLKKERHKYSS